MKTSTIKNSIKLISIISIWIVVWEIMSYIINREIYLPSPITTYKSLINILKDINTYKIILITSYRTLLSLLLSIIIGILLGTVSGLYKPIYELLNPLIVILRSTPIISIIILTIICFKSTYVPIFASFLMCFPIIFTSVTMGIYSTDKKLLQMCKIYNIKKWLIIKKLYFHYISPHLYSSIISIIGIAWKAVAAAEVLSMPKYSIGINLYYAKAYLEVENLFAWTIIIILMSSLFEKIFIRIFKYDKTKKCKKKF